MRKNRKKIHNKTKFTDEHLMKVPGNGRIEGLSWKNMGPKEEEYQVKEGSKEL